MHYVLGASGGIGSAIVRRLAALGQPVCGLSRSRPHKSLAADGADWKQVDALDADALTAACEGATTLYHCVNVPYGQWDKVMLPITEAVLAAAERRNARLVFIGNVYGYGHLNSLPAAESHPLDAHTRKGKLRNVLEAHLLKAHREGRVELILPRFPDFYGPGVDNGLMTPIFRAAMAGRKAVWPASLEQPHDLIYVEDAAAATVKLALEGEAGERCWHVPGAGALTGRSFLELIFEAVGQPPKVGVLHSWLLRAAGVVNRDAWEFSEMLYEFSEPLLLDGSRFNEAHDDFDYTSHATAIERTVEWYREAA